MNATQTVLRLVLVRLACLAIAVASIGGIYRTAAADIDSDIIAIGVLLEPEAAMVRYAQAANADLRRRYPPGYALDADRCPRITLLQRYVRVSDLPYVIGAVAAVANEERATTLQLDTNGYDYEFRSPGDIGVMSLNVDVHAPLRVFEEMVVEAVEPYAVKGGTANAFAISRGGTPVTKETIDWVEYFVPAFSGEHYAANLPVGIGHKAYLEEVRARPFEPLTFGVTGVSIYQLGPAGTAQKFLWESEGIHACDCPFEE